MCIIIFRQHDLLATAEDVVDMVVGTYLCTSWKLNPYFLFNSLFLLLFSVRFLKTHEGENIRD